MDDAVSSSAYNNGFEFKDAVKQANEYAYDKNGNLTKDLNRNITSIQYNCLNLDKIGCTSTKENKSKLLLPFVFGLHFASFCIRFALSLPSKVTFGNGNTITYLYAADGTKLRTVHKIGSNNYYDRLLRECGL